MDSNVRIGNSNECNQLQFLSKTLARSIPHFISFIHRIRSIHFTACIRMHVYLRNFIDQKIYSDAPVSKLRWQLSQMQMKFMICVIFSMYYIHKVHKSEKCSPFLPLNGFFVFFLDGIRESRKCCGAVCFSVVSKNILNKKVHERHLDAIDILNLPLASLQTIYVFIFEIHSNKCCSIRKIYYLNLS